MGLSERERENLEQLCKEGVLQLPVVLWRIPNNMEDVVQWFRERNIRLLCAVDNFKYTMKEQCGVKIYHPSKLKTLPKPFTVLMMMKKPELALRQLVEYDVTSYYGINDLEGPANQLQSIREQQSDIKYHFIDRSKGKKTMCYILAGYQEFLWDNTLERMYRFSEDSIDYCIASSGVYSEKLASIAERYGWSYLSTEKNQVCVVQNLAIDLHPKAEKIFKLDEDIFLGEHYFADMLEAYDLAERTGDSRIGCLAPVIPVNFYGYITFLKELSKLDEFEARFGKAYRGKYGPVYFQSETGEYIWKLTGQIDEMCKRFRNRKPSLDICNSYYNIGCILFTRERWGVMGGWPFTPGGTGMGEDEQWILFDNSKRDMVIYEAQNVLAGHFAFGHQRKHMEVLYANEPEIFAIPETSMAATKETLPATNIEVWDGSGVRR